MAAPTSRWTIPGSIKFSSTGEGLWRRAWAAKLNGNLYPTHGLGPIANCLHINRGDRFDHLVSMSGPSRGLQDWLLTMLLLAVPHLVVLLRQAADRRRTNAGAALLLRADGFCKRLLYSPLLRFQAFWPAAGLALLAVVSLTPPLGRQVPKQEGDCNDACDERCDLRTRRRDQSGCERQQHQHRIGDRDPCNDC